MLGGNSSAGDVPGPAATGSRANGLQGPGAITLIATKLMVPEPPRHAVVRPRLHALLATGCQAKLMLVAAPAGFGKTALLSEWSYCRPGQSAPVAWVSLDATDNDPCRFWAYALGALARTGVAVDLPASVAIERDGPRPPEVTLAPLLNSMAELCGERTLVLDDYHTISSPEIHEELAFLIRHLPPRLHLVILTRSDPPFPLARWRAGGGMAEIRARDLAFNREETERFLGEQGLVLPDPLLGRLCARLEGWAVALRLVSLWVAGRDDPSGRIAEFVASDATIADYLTGEVLDHVSVARRRFLLRTSILRRLTGSLCDAVTGEGGGGESLRELERDQLFLEAIDPGRQWFRYHQLFEELLRHELSRESPELVGELHRRACEWLGAHGFLEEAIDHGLAAGDWASVQGLMLRETLALGTRYSPGRVGDWLSVLPAAVIEGSPFFLVVRAFVDEHAGRIEHAKAELGTALAIVGSPGHPAELPEMTALIYVLLLGAARLECDLVAARSYGRRTRAELAASGRDASELGRMVAASVTANVWATEFWHGDLSGAEQHLSAAVAETASGGLVRMGLNCMSTLALIRAMTGRLREAAEMAAAARELAQRVGLATTWQVTLAQLAEAMLLIERGDPASARTECDLIIERAHRHGDRAAGVLAGVLSARAAAAVGDPRGGSACLDAAKRLWPHWELPPVLAAFVAEEEARLSVLQGDLASARAVRSRFQELAADAHVTVAWRRKMTEARILLAEGEADRASARLGPLAEMAEAAGEHAVAVEAMVLQSSARRARADPSGALAILKRALVLAEPEEMVGPFLREAVSVRPLLVRAATGAGEVGMPGFRERLLAGMGAGASLGMSSATLATFSLTERERTVLRLLGGNLSNREMAAALSVSVNTLKTHIKHIFSKLGAANRTEALRQARELELI